MRGARRAGRRAGRRTARRTTHRTMRRVRRRRRRRILVGGMVVLSVGGAAYGAVKLSQQDAQRIEERTGQSVEELSDEELTGAMNDLGIQSQEITEEDQVALGAETEGPDSSSSADSSYLEELEKLAGLRDRGIITEDEFEAKKKQLLGL